VAKRLLRYAKDKRHPGSFVAIPHAVIRSKQFAQLSSHAVKLLVDLLAQYRGDNNGDLCATWTMMSDRGWRSRDTLGNALKELITKQWITQTRQGGMNLASLYGVTFFALDPSSKLDVSAKAFPRGAWHQIAPIVQVVNKRDRQHAERADPRAFNPEGVALETPSAFSQPAGRGGAEALVE